MSRSIGTDNKGMMADVYKSNGCLCMRISYESVRPLSTVHQALG